MEPSQQVPSEMLPIKGVVYPPVDPPRNRRRRTTNQLQYLLNTVMKGVWRHRSSWPFKKPVDSNELGLPDYYEVIKQPMDLGTVKKRLENYYYWSANECIQDFKTIFQNCYTYNGLDCDISSIAKTLERYFERVLKSMPENEVEIDTSPPKNWNSLHSVGASKLLEASSSSIGPLHTVGISGQQKRRRQEEEETRSTTQSRVPLSDELKRCNEILKELFSKKHSPYAWPFYGQVNVELLALQNYNDVIKNPMDLGVIKKKIDSRKYTWPSEFVADVRLMFINCYRYYPPNHEFVGNAKKLQDVFEMLYTNVFNEDSSGESNSSVSDSEDGAKCRQFKRKLQDLLEETHNLKQQLIGKKKCLNDEAKDGTASLRAAKLNEQKSLKSRAANKPATASKPTSVKKNVSETDTLKSISNYEKRQLALSIQSLSMRKLMKLWQIAKSYEPRSCEETMEDLVIDLGKIKPVTFRLLQEYVTSCHKKNFPAGSKSAKMAKGKHEIEKQMEDVKVMERYEVAKFEAVLSTKLSDTESSESSSSTGDSGSSDTDVDVEGISEATTSTAAFQDSITHSITAGAPTSISPYVDAPMPPKPLNSFDSSRTEPTATAAFQDSITHSITAGAPTSISPYVDAPMPPKPLNSFDSCRTEPSDLPNVLPEMNSFSASLDTSTLLPSIGMPSLSDYAYSMISSATSLNPSVSASVTQPTSGTSLNRLPSGGTSIESGHIDSFSSNPVMTEYASTSGIAAMAMSAKNSEDQPFNDTAQQVLPFSYKPESTFETVFSNASFLPPSRPYPEQNLASNNPYTNVPRGLDPSRNMLNIQQIDYRGQNLSMPQPILSTEFPQLFQAVTLCVSLMSPQSTLHRNIAAPTMGAFWQGINFGLRPPSEMERMSLLEPQRQSLEALQNQLVDANRSIHLTSSSETPASKMNNVLNQK